MGNIFDGSVGSTFAKIVTSVAQAFADLFGKAIFTIYNWLPVVGSHPLSFQAYVFFLLGIVFFIGYYKFNVANG